MQYQTTSAVLFIIFNRPDTTAKVFEQIKTARPGKLYIAADGPRSDKQGEAELCAQTRHIANQIDWDCQLQTLYRDNNLGCKEAVSSAITWFFNNEEEGIILEDDCLPANSFFKFCDTLLDKYRFDTRIRHIGGCNLQQGKVWGNASYYFSNWTHVWGWASWRRVWNDYDKELTRYDKTEVRDKLSNIFTDPLIIDSWQNIFNDVKDGKIDTWDYQLAFTNFFNNSLSVIPNNNLISNIGFGQNATHSGNEDSLFANVPLAEIDTLTHPLYILPEKQADLFTLNYFFNVDERRRKQNSFKKRVKRWFKTKA
jgi:hypothetical protein